MAEVTTPATPDIHAASTSDDGGGATTLTETPPIASPQTPPGVSQAAFDAKIAEMNKSHKAAIEEISAKFASSAGPAPLPLPYVREAETMADAKLGKGADPHLRAQWISSHSAIQALEYQLGQPGADRPKLMNDIRAFQSQRATTEAAVRVQQFDPAARADDVPAQGDSDTNASADVSSIPFAQLENEAAILPLLQQNTPLLAAAIGSGAVSYSDVLARIQNKEANPAMQWESVVMTLERELGLGHTITPVATEPAATAAPAQGNPAAGMPPSGGAQSDAPTPSRNNMERARADAEFVAQLQAKHDRAQLN